MNTQDLLDTVMKYKSIIVTVEASQIGIIKRRLSNMRSRQQVALGVFADNLRLDYTIISNQEGIAEGVTRLRISLIGGNRKQLGITNITPAKEF